MKNIKIDFTSRAFILSSYIFLIGAGLIIVTYAAWYLNIDITDSSQRIEEVLNLKDRVTIEVVDMKKLNAIQNQLKKHDELESSKQYVNPFIDKQKNER